MDLAKKGWPSKRKGERPNVCREYPETISDGAKRNEWASVCMYAHALVCVASPPGKLTTLMNVRKSATSKRKCMSSSARCNVRLSGPESALSFALPPSNALNLRLILSIIRPREKSNPWEILIHRAFSFSRKKKEICIDRIPITKEKSWIWASKKEMYNLYIFFYYSFDLSGKFHRRDPKSDPRPSK